MGAGIALVAAQVAKSNVILLDQDPNTLSKSLNFLDSLMIKDVGKGKITEEIREETKKRIRTTTSLNDFKDVPFVIEAVSENTELKQKIFRELSSITRKDAILATNTSSISITKIGSVTDRPSKVIGMHFMNPVPVMKLVEIIPSLATDDETLNTTLAFAAAMGKVTTRSRDIPGFIANRLLMPYINEAAQALMEGIGSREDIDTTMKLGTNMPMGPLTLADFIGLDTCLSIMQVLHTQLGDSKYRPSPLLVKHVEAGWLGKKNGRGFYTYPETPKPAK
eukprot:TRINITY_DN17080_c0_g1_i1.p1 TRINITY_DN17080_c0_g1~~TRINITY_DN17080_c0_g1_i1.p1  ORF type:complete len:321 (+),score=84.31 TRINITY_DN17080_c0_g1_i1:128-964(+)